MVCRGVDGLFDGGSIEVYGCSGRRVLERAREAEDIPEERAGCGDLVDVPALVIRRLVGRLWRKGRGQKRREETYWIDGHGSVDDVVIEGAVVVCTDAF